MLAKYHLDVRNQKLTQICSSKVFLALALPSNFQRKLNSHMYYEDFFKE